MSHFNSEPNDVYKIVEAEFSLIQIIAYMARGNQCITLVIRERSTAFMSSKGNMSCRLPC